MSFVHPQNLMQSQMCPTKYARHARRKKLKGWTVPEFLDDKWANEHQGDDRIKSIHPTKGFRSTSFTRLMAAGGLKERWSVFWDVIEKAQKHAAKRV